MEIKIYMTKELGTWNAVVPSSFSKTGIWNLERVPFLPRNLELGTRSFLRGTRPALQFAHFL